MHLVDSIIRIYNDAWSPEHQNPELHFGVSLKSLALQEAT